MGKKCKWPIEEFKARKECSTLTFNDTSSPNNTFSISFKGVAIKKLFKQVQWGSVSSTITTGAGGTMTFTATCPIDCTYLSHEILNGNFKAPMSYLQTGTFPQTAWLGITPSGYLTITFPSLTVGSITIYGGSTTW